jgi:hypothetical protein
MHEAFHVLLIVKKQRGSSSNSLTWHKKTIPQAMIDKVQPMLVGKNEEAGREVS